MKPLRGMRYGKTSQIRRGGARWEWWHWRRGGAGQTLDKRHQILLSLGLQSYALSIKDDVFHLGTVQNANFTGVMWIQGEYNNALLGAAPGYPWARWASSQADMPPQASPTNEAP